MKTSSDIVRDPTDLWRRWADKLQVNSKKGRQGPVQSLIRIPCPQETEYSLARLKSRKKCCKMPKALGNRKLAWYVSQIVSKWLQY